PCESGVEKPAKPALTPHTSVPRCLTVSSVAAACAVGHDAASKPVAMMILFILLLLLMTHTLQRAVDGLTQAVDDHVDIVRRRDIGRREQDMIAAATIHASARGITAEPAFEGDRLDALVQFQRRIERRAGGAIGDQVDGLEQAAAPDVADMPVITKTLGQAPLKMAAEIPDPVEQLLVIDH